jgi:DNA-binding MarR family transcriptional regulator
MRAKGWLEEAPGDDQRSRPFRLTAEGEKLLRAAISAWEQAQAKTVRLLGKKNVAHLKTITSNVRAAAPTG